MNDTLQISTPTERDVVLTRVFDAPRHLVYSALTTPVLLERWYGQRGWSLIVCEIDLRVGGRWRFVSRRPDGKTVGQFGVYREIVPGQRLVNSEQWEDWDAGETLVTTVLTERNGKTTYTSTICFPSQQVRDTVVKAGLQSGAAAMYERLAEVLVSESAAQSVDRSIGNGRSA